MASNVEIVFAAGNDAPVEFRHSDCFPFEIRLDENVSKRINDAGTAPDQDGLGIISQVRSISSRTICLGQNRIFEWEARHSYPVEETIKAILESAIPDFYADFLLERAGFGTTPHRNGVGIPTGV